MSIPSSVGVFASSATFARCQERIAACMAGRPWHSVEFESNAETEVDVAYFSHDVFASGSFNAERFFERVQRAQRLSWLQMFSAGLNRPSLGALRKRGVALTTGAGAAAISVAVTAFTGMLMLARGFPGWMRAQADRNWHERADFAPPDLDGQLALIVGAGPIGREIARLCRAVGMRTLAVRHAPEDAPGFDRTTTYAHISDFLGHADWIFVACPLTEQTRELLDDAALRRCEPGAHLINVARGAVVQEDALVAALSEHRLAGAYLDVFTEEPLSVESPLWNLPNVIISPHAAGRSAGLEARVDAIFIDNLERWLRGSALVNQSVV